MEVGAVIVHVTQAAGVEAFDLRLVDSGVDYRPKRYYHFFH